MKSVKEILSCLGHSGESSVLRDMFGYMLVPKELSVKNQIEWLSGKHYHVNVISVVPEDFPDNSFHQICYSLQVTREIYGTVGVGIGRINWYQISRSQAGSKAVVDSVSEASDLTSDWTVDNNGLDLFIVRQINGADGWSAVGGSCDKNSKGMTGSVVELYVGNDNYAANGFAHEMGHYLGLDHIADTGNIIGGDGSSDSWTGIYQWQGDKMKTHCFIRNGC